MSNTYFNFSLPPQKEVKHIVFECMSNECIELIEHNMKRYQRDYVPCPKCNKSHYVHWDGFNYKVDNCQ